MSKQILQAIDHIIDETTEHISKWNTLAVEHSVPQALIKSINSNLRLGPGSEYLSFRKIVIKINYLWHEF